MTVGRRMSSLVVIQFCFRPAERVAETPLSWLRCDALIISRAGEERQKGNKF